jgi:hypothetical protein
MRDWRLPRCWLVQIVSTNKNVLAVEDGFQVRQTAKAGQGHRAQSLLVKDRTASRFGVGQTPCSIKLPQTYLQNGDRGNQEKAVHGNLLNLRSRLIGLIGSARCGQNPAGFCGKLFRPFDSPRALHHYK